METIQTITTPAQFAAAAGSPEAVIHLDVDWAQQAMASRSVVAEFVQTAARDSRLRDVAFYRLDCTEQEGPLWDALEAWQDKQNADIGLRYGGYGAVLWVRNGKQRDGIMDAAKVGVEGLLQRTRAFAEALDESR